MAIKKTSKGFTLIELLVVIAIIGILATISVLALQNARSKSRDAKRVADAKQIQTALELFFNDNNRYPTIAEWNTGKIYSTTTGATSTYMQIIPTAPTPADGSCESGQNAISYTPSSDGSSYSISFCLGGNTGTLSSGPKCLTPSGIIDADCSVSSVSKFVANIGGTGSQYATAVIQSSDGSYVVVGNNGDQVYLVKIDTAGALVWEKTFGDAGSQQGASVQQTADGGFIITGYTDANGGDVYLVKTDSSGTLVWEKTFGDTGGQSGYSVQQTADGGYIVTGVTNANSSDAYLVKTDSSGTLVWEKNFGGTGGQYGYSVQEISGGGYVVAGATSVNDSDAYLAKTDASGNLISESNIGGAGVQRASSVQQTTDGGFILFGTNANLDVEGDAYLVKTDITGSVEWQSSIGGTAGQSAYSGRQTSDGGYIVSGEGYAADPVNGDAYLAKTDASGNLVWEKNIGGNGGQNANSVVQTSDGGYVLAGYSDANSDDFFVVKTDSLGNAE